MKKSDLLYEIEKNIPIPPPSQWGKNLNFIKKLEVGDSFVVEKRSRGSIVTSARRTEIVLATRVLEDGRVRVWRTK